MLQEKGLAEERKAEQKLCQSVSKKISVFSASSVAYKNPKPQLFSKQIPRSPYIMEGRTMQVFEVRVFYLVGFKMKARPLGLR